MLQFLHHPSNRTLEASGQRAQRYRRSHRFTELTDTDTVSPIKNVMSSSPTDPLPDSSSSPQSPRQSTPDAPDQPPDSPQIPTDAPHAPAPPFDDLTLADIVKHSTVADVLWWVDRDPQRARQALDAETQGRNRVTLTSKLRRIT